METTQELKALVDQLPAADDRGLYTENIDGERIEKAIGAIYEGGGDALRQLIGMLGEPGSEADVKPHYALHCVVNRALIKKDDSARRELCETMAAALSGELSDDNKAFLCQELQWAGGNESVVPLGRLLLNESLVEFASMALVAIGGDAVVQFRNALPESNGKCRRNIVDGLAALADAQSTTAMRRLLRDSDREARLAAGAGLAKIGDAAAVDALLNAADGDPGWERIQATKHCLVCAENLLAAGKKDEAKKIYAHLRNTRSDPAEEYVRLVASAALAKVN